MTTATHRRPTAPNSARQTLRIIYGRASTDKRSEGLTKSVNSQLSDEIKRADAEGVRIAAGGTGPRGTFRDDGISASRFTNKTREEWMEVMALIHSGDVMPGDELAVWNIGRGTRDRPVWAQLMGALITAGMMLLVDGKRHDPSDPDDGFMLDLMAALAFRESAKISKDLRKSVRERVADGRPSGPMPFGYRQTFDEKGKPLGRKAHPTESLIVKEMVRRFLKGDTAIGIAVDLNRRGVAASRGGAWTGSMVVKIIERPVYARIVIHQGAPVADVVGKWPALVTMGQHRAVVAKLRDPARLTVRNGSHVRHLVTGWGRCCCGAPLRTASREGRKDGARTITYRCSVISTRGQAGEHVTRDAAAVDELVTRAAIARLRDPNLIAALAAAADDGGVAAAAAEEAATLSERLDQARGSFAAGALPLDSLTAIESAVGPRLAAARAASVARHTPGTVVDLAGPDAAANWQRAPLAVRREVARRILTVTILPTTLRGIAAIGKTSAADLCVTIEPH